MDACIATGKNANADVLHVIRLKFEILFSGLKYKYIYVCMYVIGSTYIRILKYVYSIDLQTRNGKTSLPIFMT